MKAKHQTCQCSSGEFLVMSCSGASDVGQLSDLVARELRDKNQRTMKCLAMVSAKNEPLIESLKSADVLVIDGCPVDCGKKIMQIAGIDNFNYIRLSDWGYIKGQVKITPELIREVYEKAVVKS